MRRGQQKLQELFRQQQAFPWTSSKWVKLTESLCYFLAEDTLPFYTVNGSGFRKFYKIWSQGTNLQTRKLDLLYVCQGSTKLRKNQFYKSCKVFGFTTHMWISQFIHSFVSLTVHSITDEYHLNHYLLKAKKFTESRTAVNIAEEMISIINEWGLEYVDLIAATTDIASNIRAALHILQCLHMPCFSHLLNLAVEKAMVLPGVSRALACYHQVTSHFHHSTEAFYVFKRKQGDLHSVQHNLLHDVFTR